MRKLGPKLWIVDVGNDIIRFKFQNEFQVRWVLDNKSWCFDNNLLVLGRQWENGMTARNINFKSSTMLLSGYKYGVVRVMLFYFSPCHTSMSNWASNLTQVQVRESNPLLASPRKWRRLVVRLKQIQWLCKQITMKNFL